VFNKLDKLVTEERARLKAVYPGALAVSALTGEGRDELVAAMEARLALDTARVHLGFDATSDGDRDQIAQLYRVAKILRHESTNGHISIEAEIPRRVLDRFQNRAATAS
jgi:GTP-binding protein HflX